MKKRIMHSYDTKIEVIKMRQEGYSIKSIMKQLGFPKPNTDIYMVALVPKQGVSSFSSTCW